MKDLVCLQQQFQSYLLSQAKEIAQSIVRTKNCSSKTRLGIYSNAYQERLLEALASNYPCLNSYLGDELFREMGFHYLQAHPSTYRSLRWFGDKLVEHLTHYYEETTPCLIELAEFEWTMNAVFDAPDAPVFKLEQMASIPPEHWGSMLIKVHPSLRTFQGLWNTVAIWEALTNEETPPEVVENSQAVNWVLWRHDYNNLFYSLSPEETFAINALQKGYNFAELCEGLCQWYAEDEIGMQAASLLKGWIQSGLITEIWVETQPSKIKQI